MKKYFYALLCAVVFSAAVPIEAMCADATISAQVAPKKKTASRKAGAKKATSRPYKASAYGDCYLGEGFFIDDEGYVDLTFQADGTCVLKFTVNNRTTTYNGTYTGTVTGTKYKIKFVINDRTYELVGNKNHLEFMDPFYSFDLNLEQ